MIEGPSLWRHGEQVLSLHWVSKEPPKDAQSQQLALLSAIARRLISIDANLSVLAGPARERRNRKDQEQDERESLRSGAAYDRFEEVMSKFDMAALPNGIYRRVVQGFAWSCRYGKKEPPWQGSSIERGEPPTGEEISLYNGVGKVTVNRWNEWRQVVMPSAAPTAANVVRDPASPCTVVRDAGSERKDGTG